MAPRRSYREAAAKVGDVIVAANYRSGILGWVMIVVMNRRGAV